MLKAKHKTGVFLLNIISKTWRFKVNGNKPEKPSVIVFWHGLMLPAWKFFSGSNPNALVSLSSDGEILSALLTKWNFNVIRGSSSKGGRQALEQMIDNAAKGYLLITPDGPRGPARKFKPGAAVAARKSGVPLVLCGVRPSARIMFGKSWDRFIIPMPFSAIHLNFSKAYSLDSGGINDEVRIDTDIYEDELNELSGQYINRSGE